MWTVPELVKLGCPFVGNDLAGQQTRLLLSSVGERFPAAFSIGCFECRLDDDDRVDILACTARGDGAQRFWRGRRRGGSVERLLGAWASAGQSPLRKVSAIWFEFDVRDGGIAAPFAFLRVAGLRSRSSFLPIVVAAASALDVGLVNDWRVRLRHVEKELHPRGRILDFAIVPHGDAAVRLHAAIDREALPRFLTSIGWSGPVPQLKRMLAGWRDINAPIDIQLQVGARVEPWLDIEFMLAQPPKRDARWRPILKLLREERLARQDKLGAAISFTGRDDSRKAWPLRVERRLQVKLRVSARGPSAKAYLAFVPRFSFV